MFVRKVSIAVWKDYLLVLAHGSPSFQAPEAQHSREQKPIIPGTRSQILQGPKVQHSRDQKPNIPGTKSQIFQGLDAKYSRTF